MTGPTVYPPPPDCHPEGSCTDCDGQHLSRTAQRRVAYEAALTDAEAAECIGTMIKNINDARDALKDKLDVYGDLVLTRWTKKSKPKRAAVLQATELLKEIPLECPEAGHDPFIRTIGNVWSSSRWMNPKTFSEDRMRFLSLLHVRVAFAPADWTMLDCRESEPAWVALNRLKGGVARFLYNPKCVGLCGEAYGALLNYDVGLAHSWAIVGFPRAYLAISTQTQIILFLLQVVDKLVDKSEGTGNAKWSALVAGGFRGSGCEALWSSYTTPAFAPPVNFDPAMLLQKAEARLHMVLDEFEFMQTDPIIMRGVIQQRRASIAWDDSSDVRAEIRWGYLTYSLISETMNRLNQWNVISMAGRELCKAFAASGATRGRPLTMETDKALDVFHGEIAGRMRIHCNFLKAMTPTLAALKPRYIAYDGRDVVTHREINSMDASNTADRLAKLIKGLSHTMENGIPSYGLGWHFDFLERELLAQGPARMIDHRMLQNLSDLATMEEMYGICLRNQVGNAKFLSEMRSQQYHHQYTLNLYKQEAVRIDPSTQRSLSVLLRHFYEAPWPKGRQDLQWLAKAQESRKRLAAFWQAVRKASPTLSRERKWLQPEHLAEIQLERQRCEEGQRALEIAAADAAEKLGLEVQKPPQTAWGDSNSDEAQPIKRKQTKAKVARNATSESDTETEGIHAATHNPDLTTHQEERDESPIFVKVDSMSVFTKMYPGQGAASESVRWPQLVEAMTDAGLTATDTGGSAVSFSSDAGTIVLHKPHPDPVVDPIMLQGIGKRMKKWFNWHRERFEVRGKEMGM